MEEKSNSAPGGSELIEQARIRRGKTARRLAERGATTPIDKTKYAVTARSRATSRRTLPAWEGREVSRRGAG